MRVRRGIYLILALATYAILAGIMGWLLFGNGWSVPKTAMYVGFLLSLPWAILGFWNALIGLAVTHLSKDPAGLVNPCLRHAPTDTPIAARVALAICIRNEDILPVERRVATMRQSLDAAGFGGNFDIFLLSDSSRPETIAAEQEAVARLQSSDSRPGRITYRRRDANIGFKAGNLRDFVERWGNTYPFFIPLDADSLMSGPALLRLTRIMQAFPRLGILQSLVVGLPATSFFTRVFQFGMRHGMRSYTIGGAWWQGDCGPYWGHNAIIRSQPFRDDCKLPLLPSRSGPGIHILSHDQVEAVLMRRAGYEVRVIADEFGSFEENPPALPEFVKRDLRWCQGNMQYWRLLGMPGLLFMSRIQLLLAILMYLAAPGWILFLIIGTSDLFALVGTEPLVRGVGIRFFFFMYFMSLTPKLAGLADVISDRRRFASYGGGRLFTGAIAEFIFTTMLAPCVSLTETIFMAGLAMGRRMGWDAQKRSGTGIPWALAVRGLWPHTLFGFTIGIWLAIHQPSVLIWAFPIILATALAIPFAVFTASPAAGRWATRIGLCAIPEERITPWEVEATCGTLLTVEREAMPPPEPEAV